MTKELYLDGGCTCGSVRYRMSSDPLFVHCCHCRWCQRETGSSYVLNALIEADRVELLAGSVEATNTPTVSGKGQRIFRCHTCMVAVWSKYAFGSIGDDVLFVRVGTLDDPDALPPDIHIYTESKQAWVVLGPAIPSAPEYYETASLWSAKSLERRAALIAAKLRR